PRSGEEDLRGFEWRYLWQLSRPNELASFPGGKNAVSFSTDGNLFAISGSNFVIRETSSYRIVTNLSGGPLSLSFSPRDKILAAGEVRKVRLWDTETWGEVRPALSNSCYPARFSPDGA